MSSVLFRGLLLLLLSAAAAAQDFALPGPHEVATLGVSIDRGDGTAFPAWMVYPAATAGSGAAPDPSASPYPAVVFGHGFLAPPLVYLATLKQLASWGFVVIAPRSALELFPDHDAYAADFSLVLTWLEGMDQSLGKDWAGMVDPFAVAASGHSMGGGAAVLAAADDPRFRALGLLAPADTFPTSSIERAGALVVPTLIIAGSEDAITPLRRHAVPMFRAMDAPRQLALVLGGSHCGFVSAPVPDVFCDDATLPLQQQLQALYRSLVPFLLFHLGRRPELEDEVWGWQRIWQKPTLTILDRATSG